MLSLKYVLILFYVGLLDGRKFRCDYTYFKNANGWFKFHEMPVDWREARMKCHLEGGHLASPVNLAMRVAMNSMIKRNNVTCAVFIGVHATVSKGDFYSIEGVPLSEIPHIWAEGEPNNQEGKENCMVMLPDGAMADTRCSEPYPYLCYKKKSIDMIVNECGTIDPEYTLDTRTGSCYKYHTVPRTWSRAYMTCAAEGGYLAILNSETEVEIIKEVFNKYPEKSILGNFKKHLVFVGFYDWSERGEWLTIHGQTLKEAGYDKFAPGEPNNVTAGEYCGSLTRTGMFNDLWCEVGHTFICEKNPDSLLCDDDN